MKLKLRTLFEAQRAIQNLLNEKLPVKAAYRVQKAIRLIGEELKDFEAVRLDLAKKFADGADEVPEEKRPEFNAAIDAVLDEEVEIKIEPIPLSLLGETNLSIRDVLLLEFLLLEDE